MSEHGEDIVPLIRENDILKKFLIIMKFYNEIIKSAPLIVSNTDLIVYMKQQNEYEKIINDLDTHEPICIHTELLETHDLNIRPLPKLNIPDEKKTRFNVYILKKINDLERDITDFSRKLDYFYLRYKKYYDYFSFYNIFASTSLTLIESISLMFKPQVYTGVFSIFIGTSIAISISVLKLKNYKENIETIVKTQEKVYSCQAQLFTFDKFMKSSLNMKDQFIIDLP